MTSKTPKLKSLYEELYDREDMPQIHKDDLGSAVSKMLAVGIPVKAININLRGIEPFQRTVNREKVIRIAKAYESGEKLAPIIISQDNIIIDGHHRWLALQALGIREVVVIQIALEADQALQIYSKLSQNV